MKAIKNLSGIDILKKIQKGHMVRRSCWVPGFLIRVCNEMDFDTNGDVIFNDRTTLYTHATNGYFMHIGSSSQPFNYPHFHRDGEGISMFFENDWEDYGFISSMDFNNLVEKTKDKVRKLERKQTKEIE